MAAIRLVALIVISGAVNWNAVESAPRSKRNLFDLQRIVKQVADVNAFTQLYGYGNYCGWGGSGEPVDEIDECCQAHDSCYDNRGSCRNFKWLGYDYSCILGSLCWCKDKNDSCEYKACWCDLTFAWCIWHHRQLLSG